jgi:hypothetical protein
MNKPARRVLVAVAALAPLAAVPAAFAEAPGASAPAGVYTLVLAPAQGGGTDTGSLTCGPDGSGHPAAATACAQLTAAGGQVSAIPGEKGMCPMIWRPVTATAVGLWNGRPRYYSRTFTNRCVAVRSTGGVLFRF